MSRPETDRHSGSYSRKRILVVIGVPMFALAAVLAWGVAQSGGEGGRPGVNDVFGVIETKPLAAPEFQLELFDGTELRRSDLNGKVVMLDFWASWCVPCRLEAPVLQRVYESYAGAPVEFVGIDIWDDRDTALGHMERYGLTFPSGLDDRGRIAVEYGVRGLPEKFLLTPDGTIVKKIVGPVSSGSLRDAVDELLEASVLKPQSN